MLREENCDLIDDGYKIRTVDPELNTLLTYWPKPISVSVNRISKKWYKTKDKYLIPEEIFACRTKHRV